MNRTTITFKKEKVTLVFGTWVMGQLLKRGYKLTEIQEEIQKNPFEFLTLLFYLAAVNGHQDKDLSAFNQDDFYDWLDDNGGIAGEEVTRLTNVFFVSIVGDNPKKEGEDTGKKPKPAKRL